MTDTDLAPRTTGLIQRTPDTVPDALDLHVRLGALAKLATTRQREVAAWVKERGLARKAEDGAAPTWRVGESTVTLTDPKPTPRITDPEALARWLIQDVGGADPDGDPDHRGRSFATPVGFVERRTVASVESDALLEFLTRYAADDAEGMEPDAAETLADSISVDEQWWLPADALDLLVKARPYDDGDTPLVALVEASDGWAMIHTADGELVPGVEVTPPGAPQVQFRPDATTKKQVTDELDRLLRPPAVED